MGTRRLLFAGDHRFDACGGDFFADSIGIMAAICEERLDAVGNHVGGGIASRQFGQRLKHRIEHAGRDPFSLASENAVPLAIFIGQMPPLRSGSRNPHLIGLLFVSVAPVFAAGHRAVDENESFL